MEGRIGDCGRRPGEGKYILENASEIPGEDGGG